MKTHVEINAKNLIHNLSEFKKLTNKKIMFAVKANAYGHGLKEIITIAREFSHIDYYAVDNLEEALIVNAIDNKKKILVLGWADEPQIREMILKGIELVTPSLEYYRKVESIARELNIKARVHIKIETGTARLGMSPNDALKIFNGSKDEETKHVLNIGIYSHFANIEDTTDHSFAQSQLEIFNHLLKKIGDPTVLKHFSCSASALLFPKTYFDIIRIGISAYGFWPSKPTYVSYMEKKKPSIRLKPVLGWYTKVAQVKTIKQGDSIGYGLTYRAFNKSKIVVIPIGYYDGYDRKLSNVSRVIINGISAPVRGRICMNMIMADVTHIKNIQPGDQVILIGEGGKEKITADELGDLANTINYEMVARINPLIPRIIV